MLIMSPVNGTGVGDWKQDLLDIKTPPYKCTASICYAIGPDNHRLFLSLQTAINRWAGQAGFNPIQVDGLLGKETTDALDKIWPGGSGAKKEVLAADAQKYLNLINKLGDGKQLPHVPAPPKVSPSTAKQEAKIAKAADDKPYKMHTPGLGNVSPWWFIGGVAVVALGIIGYKIYKRRQGDTAIYAER